MRTQSAVLTAFTGLVSLHLANAYFVVSGDVIVRERIDPVVNPGELSSHTHSIIGVSADLYLMIVVHSRNQI
jgi:hypothetical protein